MTDMQQMGLKTVGGVTTAVTTYAVSFTITDIQAYAVVFASICTGVYYLAATYKTLRNKKERRDAENTKS